MGFKKQQTPPEFTNYEPQEYRTGSTAPKKSYQGIIALLLAAVIILSGAVSILGIMNIRLFRQLANGSGETLPFMLSSTAPSEAAVPWVSEDIDTTVSQFPGDDPFAPTGAISGILSPDRSHLDAHTDEIAHGICGESVSVFYQNYYHLPQGFYITEVLPGSCAEAAGLCPGDILLALNGCEVTHYRSLEAFFAQCTPGETIAVTIYRNGKQITIPFSINNPQK
jgi:hypothetical protein